MKKVGIIFAMKEELEETIKKLENTDTTLDDAMDLFEKGITLTKTCRKLLSEAQLKVTKIVGNEKEEDFISENE